MNTTDKSYFSWLFIYLMPLLASSHDTTTSKAFLSKTKLMWLGKVITLGGGAMVTACEGHFTGLIDVLTN